LNKWKNLGKKVLATWNKVSAADETSEQREKNGKKLTVDSSVIISSLLNNEIRHKEAFIKSAKRF